AEEPHLASGDRAPHEALVVRGTATACIHSGRHAHRNQGGVGVHTRLCTAVEEMRVEVDQPREDKAAVRVDRDVGSDGFMRAGLDGPITVDENIARAIDAPIGINHRAAGDAQTDLHQGLAAEMPPSTISSVAVMYRASSDTMKRTA